MPRRKPKKEEAFVVDTYKAVESGTFVAAAVKFLGKRRIEALRWNEQQFSTRQEADAYVRTQCAKLGMCEMESTGSWSYGR